MCTQVCVCVCVYKVTMEIWKETHQIANIDYQWDKGEKQSVQGLKMGRMYDMITLMLRKLIKNLL